MEPIFASRYSFSTGYSRVKPYPPWRSTHSEETLWATCEETSFAILLLNAFSKQFDKTTFIEIGKWFDIGITNWGHTDALCAYFFREFFKRKIIAIEDLSAWRKASNKYQRRAVPVAMIEILRAKGDFNGLLEFIDPMMPDPERVVHQGLGWFLREAWKRYPNAVEDLLMKWKDTAARLIFQYATEKMSKEERMKFRKTKDKKQITNIK